MVKKRLNHEWVQTFNVDVDPFDETTFPFILPEEEFILNQIIPLFQSTTNMFLKLSSSAG